MINPRTGQITTVLPAKEIMDMIVVAAHKNGEPGLLFIDRINEYNPMPHIYKIESTNPCGLYSFLFPNLIFMYKLYRRTSFRTMGKL